MLALIVVPKLDQLRTMGYMAIISISYESTVRHATNANEIREGHHMNAHLRNLVFRKQFERIAKANVAQIFEIRTARISQ